MGFGNPEPGHRWEITQHGQPPPTGGAPQQQAGSDWGRVTIDNTGQVGFERNQDLIEQWARQHPEDVESQTSTTTHHSGSGSTTTTAGEVVNPGGHASAKLAFQTGNAWWKHPSAPQQGPEGHEESRSEVAAMSYSHVYDVYRDGQYVGSYLMTGDLKRETSTTETVTNQWTGYSRQGGGHVVYQDNQPPGSGHGANAVHYQLTQTGVVDPGSVHTTSQLDIGYVAPQNLGAIGPNAQVVTGDIHDPLAPSPAPPPPPPGGLDAEDEPDPLAPQGAGSGAAAAPNPMANALAEAVKSVASGEILPAAGAADIPRPPEDPALTPPDPQQLAEAVQELGTAPPNLATANTATQAGTGEAVPVTSNVDPMAEPMPQPTESLDSDTPSDDPLADTLGSAPDDNDDPGLPPA
ncbi:hypothetical protein [Vulcanococcus limneticus]|uniref:hypothetical protein n=1 Tax=Vulcanococcus limneticus TaxID=2170428 RepID=UPI00398C05FF